MHVDSQRLHLGDALLGVPAGTGRQPARSPCHDGSVMPPGIQLPCDAMPVAAVLCGLPEALGSEVCVYVDDAHIALSYLVSLGLVSLGLIR